MLIRMWASQHQKRGCTHTCVAQLQRIYSRQDSASAGLACELVAALHALEGSTVSACCPDWHICNHPACRTSAAGVSVLGRRQTQS